jgi:hypothetical protein
MAACMHTDMPLLMGQALMQVGNGHVVYLVAAEGPGCFSGLCCTAVDLILHVCLCCFVMLRKWRAECM